MTSIAGTFCLMGNAALTDTSGLAGLTKVGADLMMNENPALPTLSFPLLTSVGAA